MKLEELPLTIEWIWSFLESWGQRNKLWQCDTIKAGVENKIKYIYMYKEYKIEPTMEPSSTPRENDAQDEKGNHNLKTNV